MQETEVYMLWPIASVISFNQPLTTEVANDKILYQGEKRLSHLGGQWPTNLFLFCGIKSLLDLCVSLQITIQTRSTL